MSKRLRYYVARPDPLLAAFGAFPWDSQARQYPATGKPGITYAKADMAIDELVDPDADVELPIDCLLYYDADGHLVGILNHYPVAIGEGLVAEKPGNVNLWVHPDRLRQGIGSALVREAHRRWTINFRQQRYTPAGAALANHVMRKLDAQ